MQKKLRKIVLAGKTYLWRFALGYEPTNKDANSWQCHDIFIAYLKESKLSPVHIHFITWEDYAIGGPLHTGYPIDWNDPPSGGINLHTPRFAAALIGLAYQHGWQPETAHKPFVIKNGIPLLVESGLDR